MREYIENQIKDFKDLEEEYTLEAQKLNETIKEKDNDSSILCKKIEVMAQEISNLKSQLTNFININESLNQMIENLKRENTEFNDEIERRSIKDFDCENLQKEINILKQECKLQEQKITQMSYILSEKICSDELNTQLERKRQIEEDFYTLEVKLLEMYKRLKPEDEKYERLELTI